MFVWEGAREVCRELDRDAERLGGGPSTICISSSSTSIAILSLEEDLPVESVAERWGVVPLESTISTSSSSTDIALEVATAQLKQVYRTPMSATFCLHATK